MTSYDEERGVGWLSLDEAPIGRPVRVWASFDPSHPHMSWRTFLAIQKYRGWWYTYGQEGLRLYPSHWAEQAHPPEPGQAMVGP